MCLTDLIPDLDITEHEHQAEGKYPGVAWGRLAGHRDGQGDRDGQGGLDGQKELDGQDDRDGQDVAKPRA